MSSTRKIAFLFPGQGSQYPGMGKDFFDNYEEARQTFEEADDLLHRKLSKIVFDGTETALTETKNSQLGIYVNSIAILRVVQRIYPECLPCIASGLSLGEYSALTASGRLPFNEGIELVNHRAQFMNDACEATEGTMAVILGLEAEQVEKLVEEARLPCDLWIANFNCPGQIVISGTLKGIEAGSAAAKAIGAKRVLSLQVYGAFHSGLMQLAEDRLAPYILNASLNENVSCALVMNVCGGPVSKLNDIRSNLIKQVTRPVRWEQGVRYMISQGVDLFIELGCGKSLAGFNKRIGSAAPFISIEKVSDLAALDSAFN